MLSGLLLCWQHLTAQPAQPLAGTGFSPQRLARLDSLLQGWIDDGMAPHIVAYVAQHGQVVHHRAYGYRDLAARTPLRQDDIFRIASQTKAIVTVGLLMLYEEGRCLLDDPVANYLPAFAHTQVLAGHDQDRYWTRPPKRPITIRHLLTHTAGIPYDHPLDGMLGLNIPQVYANHDSIPLDTAVARIARRPLLHDPGEAFTYGLNTDVIGYLIEVLSGQPLDVYLRTRIFESLDMKDTYFYLPPAKHSRLVELYAKPSVDAPLVRSADDDMRSFATNPAGVYFSGGGGLVGTVGDYAHFCQMLLDGGTYGGHRLLGRKTVDLMFRNQIGDLRVWDRQDGFGLGLQIVSPETRYAELATPGSGTWGGMYCSEYTIDRAEGLVMIVYTNVYPYAHYGEFVRKFRVAVYQALGE
ncbi:MAG: serine hydrolase domain-containing protein [Bacteroidia bacterium]